MTNLKRLLNAQGPELVPFFISVTLYYILMQREPPVLWTTILKCAPIVCLKLYVILRGFAFPKNHKYSQLILQGLIFSCGGDILLNVDLFPHGMGLFACAQICYMFAFGFKPLKWGIGVLLYLAGLVFVVFIFADLDRVLAIGIPIYVTLLLTMCWRSLARAMHKRSFLTTFCGIGSVLFVISDGLIAVDMFITKVQNARILIMSTYYLAQLAIALSTTDEGGIKKKKTNNNSGR